MDSRWFVTTALLSCVPTRERTFKNNQIFWSLGWFYNHYAVRDTSQDDYSGFIQIGFCEHSP